MFARLMLLFMIISFGFVKAQTSDIYSLVWSNDQTMMAITRDSGNIEIIEIANNQIITVILPIYGFVFNVAWEPNNERIATNHGDDMVRIWDVSTGDLLAEFYGAPEVLTIEWSHDGKLYVSDLESGTDIWDMNSYELNGKLPFVAYDLNFSPNGEYLAIGTLTGSMIYDMETGEEFGLKGYSNIVFYTMWNQDSTKLASIDFSGNFSVWNLTTNLFETSFQMQPGVLMRWQANYLYIASNEMINIWDTTAWQIISSIPLNIGSFVSFNSTAELYAEFNESEVLEVATYCEIIESGNVSALSNAISDGNLITFKKQICLTENGQYDLTAPLPDVAGDITIIGNGAKINMTGEGRVFNVVYNQQWSRNGTLTLKDVTISGGNATEGGAVYNAGELNLEDVILENHSAVRGGAIYNAGVLTMKNGAIQNNSASEFGGGIYNAGQMSLDGVNIRENDAPEGSGVYQGG